MVLDFFTRIRVNNERLEQETKRMLGVQRDTLIAEYQAEEKRVADSFKIALEKKKSSLLINLDEAVDRFGRSLELEMTQRASEYERTIQEHDERIVNSIRDNNKKFADIMMAMSELFSDTEREQRIVEQRKKCLDGIIMEFEDIAKVMKRTLMDDMIKNESTVKRLEAMTFFGRSSYC